jgi:hypothetical protein
MILLSDSGQYILPKCDWLTFNQGDEKYFGNLFAEEIAEKCGY